MATKKGTEFITLAAVESFTEPEIEKIHDIVDCAVTTADFLIHHLVQVLYAFREIWRPAYAVDTRLVCLREGGLRGHVRVVLHPQACTAVSNP